MFSDAEKIFSASENFSLAYKHFMCNGGVAQLGEHLPCKQGVMSSNLTISIKARAKRLETCLKPERKPRG